MAGVIDIQFTTLDTCAGRIAQEIESLQTKINEIKSCDSSIDSRVKKQMGTSFDTTELENIKVRLEKTQTFLGEVKKVYSGADIDLSESLSVDYLEYLYPNFKTLSDDRKAIVLSALRYLGLSANQMGYANNFSSKFASSQFIGNATEHAWCAMFVGSIINYYYGDESIIDPSYASVWKIIGNYKKQTGIAFETDDRIHYYVSQALVDKYKRNGGFSNWESNLSKYNAEHGTNLQVSDWIKDGYIPQPGDILTFKQGNRYYTSKKDAPLSDYNEAVEKSRAAFFANDASDYPDEPQSYTHIGFVLGTREVDGVTYVDTVEGNVNDDVQVRSFRIDDPYLVGYGHIDYEKFSSDKEAIQKMVATGVDTNGSKATAATMSQHLLALHKGDLKGNYLVNLANNLDQMGTETLVVKDEPVTGQIVNLTTTSHDDPATTAPQQTTQPQTSPQQTTYQHTTTTTTTTTTGGGTSYSKTPSYSQPTYREPVQTTTEVSVPAVPSVSQTVEPVREVSAQPQSISVVTPTVETPRVVVQEPAPSYVSMPEEAVSTPVVAHIVEDYKTPDLPVTLEEVPVDEDFTYEVGFEDDWMEEEPLSIPEPSDMTIPEGVVTYENVNKPNPVSSPKKGFPFGTVALTTLGLGAAAGGAYYMAQKSKKNNDTGEEEEESEEEYSYEY